MQSEKGTLKRRMPLFLIVGVGLALSCLMVSMCGVAGYIWTRPRPLSASDISQKLGASAVRINVQFAQGSAMGSGIVFQHSSGQIYILTNAHVVEGAVAIEITLSGGQQRRTARIKGISSCDDLALLEVSDTTDLIPVTFGSSPKMGDTVYTLGFPLGSQQLIVTKGIVSTPNQKTALGNVIQVDASINHGNSGGPLVDEFGRVIGINTAIISANIANNIGFAINAKDAQPTIAQIAQSKRLLWVGMNVDYLPDGKGGIQLWDDGNPVISVTAVESGSPADRLGVQAGDLLLQVESTDITAKEGMCEILRSHGDGDVLKIQLRRDTASKHQLLEGQFSIGTLTNVQPLQVVRSEPRG